MSRAGARDTARRQLTETLNLFTAGLIILARSRTFAELAGTTEAASYLNDLDAFLALPAPEQVRQHPDNLAVDQFAATMKTKMAKSRAKGRTGWQEAHPDTLSNMLREHVEKADPVDVAIFSMMLHQLGHSIGKGDEQPFMWALKGPDGRPHYDDFCVASDPHTLEPEDESISIVPVYLRPDSTKGGALTETPPDNRVPTKDPLDAAIAEASAKGTIMSKPKKITLTYPQSKALKKLAKDPDSYVGSCTNSTMKALQKRGLADIEWSDPPPGHVYRREKWIITQAGHDLLTGVAQ